MEQLIESSELAHVDLRIVPFSASPHIGLLGSFVMVQFPNAEAPAFVYVEHERGAIHQEYRGDIDRYTAVVAAFFARVKSGDLG